MVQKKSGKEKMTRQYKFLFNKEQQQVTLVRVIDRKTKKYLRERSHLEELTFYEMNELEEFFREYNLERLLPIIKKDKKPYKRGGTNEN